MNSEEFEFMIGNNALRLEPEPVPSSFRSVEQAVAPLERLAETSGKLFSKPLPAFVSQGRTFSIPRYLLRGGPDGEESIRVGFFAGARGDQPEGTYALIEFIQSLAQASEAARDYCLFFYPILNPTGFESNSPNTADGVDITQAVWKNTNSPEAQILQGELWMHGFDGVISLKTDPDATGVTVAIGGEVLARHFLGDALTAAQDFLPQTTSADPGALPKWKGVALEEPNYLIRTAPGLKPRPFEIVITLPRSAPAFLQKAATTLLLQAVLNEYRKFISFGMNL